LTKLQLNHENKENRTEFNIRFASQDFVTTRKCSNKFGISLTAPQFRQFLLLMMTATPHQRL